MKPALQVQIQAKLDKYQRIKSKIKRYPEWMMAFHGGNGAWKDVAYSAEDLMLVNQQKLDLFGDAEGISSWQTRELARYCQIPEPLVFHQAANDNESILEELKQKHHRLYTLASHRYQANQRSIFSDTTPEDVVTPFLESQKILENALFYSEVICAGCEMMLAFIEQREVSSHYERILKVSSLEEIEMLHNEPTQKITPEMLKHISDTLIKNRSYRSFLADYIQEIIDDLSDLLAISNHAVIFQRSTASLAQSLFKEASRAEECTLKHVFK